MAAPRKAVGVPELVRRIREVRRWTQEQLAHELGVAFSTVNGWENGKHVPIPLAMRALLHLAREGGLESEAKVVERWQSLQGRRRVTQAGDEPQ
jgi:transcriptional regulator with XRE-family HTH domain